jgi:hypothetical protein
MTVRRMKAEKGAQPSMPGREATPCTARKQERSMSSWRSNCERMQGKERPLTKATQPVLERSISTWQSSKALDTPNNAIAQPSTLPTNQSIN